MSKFNTTDKIVDLITPAAEREAIRFEEEFQSLLKHCGSPIEMLLLAAVFAEHRIQEFGVVFMGDLPASLKHVRGETAYIYQQSAVGSYHTDFLILDATKPLDVADPRWMIVECDGHDYHERTKEQARHDKRRDRFFQSKGYKVLRFTGSEIWADPEACAEEVFLQMARDDEWRNRDQ